MISTLLMLLGFAGSLGEAPQATLVPTVTLTDKVLVRGTELHLGDIATIEHAEPKVLETLERLHVGYAPSPGFTRILRAGSLEQLVARRHPNLRVKFAGSDLVLVEPDTAQVPGGNIVAVAEDALARRLAGLDAEWSLTGPVRDEVVPSGVDGHGLTARVQGRPEATGGLISVGVEVRVDGQLYRTVWVPFRVSLHRRMPVLVKPVRAGEPLEASHLEFRRTRVEGIVRGALGPTALIDAVATRDLPVGSVVRSNDVHRPLLVQRGDLIHLQVRKGPITARVGAKAVQGGHRGERIRVTTESGREFVATVLGRDLVEIHLGGAKQ